MKVDDFDFELLPHFIAQRPASPRHLARLLIAENMLDNIMAELPEHLEKGDLLVFNDTRVIPARLKGKCCGAGVEVTLHMQMSADSWKVFAKPSKKLQLDNTIGFAEKFTAQVAGKGPGGEVTLRFNLSGPDLMSALEAYGRMPLPPYIKRKDMADDQDKADYQTLFADRGGAVAAPTAGLHFTPMLMQALAEKGINHTKVTLHVGAGTFLPVKVDDTEDHVMHAEWGEINEQAAATINATKAGGGKIVAIGTTSLRLLESAADEDGTLRPFSDKTDIFITPGYRFRIVDTLLTNFHLPRSTLFMLVSAFSGLQTMKDIYKVAMDRGYRFYSYGDGSLLQKDDQA